MKFTLRTSHVHPPPPRPTLPRPTRAPDQPILASPNSNNERPELMGNHVCESLLLPLNR